jgi:polar amino acid transport system substrate-binding protein
MEVGATVETDKPFAIMMPKDSPLLEEVNQAISDMKTDGTMAQLYEKWFGVAPPRTA